MDGDKRFNISVLVVDDDDASLTILADILNTLGYQVLAANNAVNALESLREFEGFVDLVITEFNISGMNGFDFQKFIQNEFHIPVINRRESVISSSLANGATRYILKPFCADDFRDIWQYAMASRKRKLTIGHIEGESLPSDNIFIQDVYSATSSNLNERKTKYCPRKSTQMNEEGQSEERPQLVKKPKVVWTTYLHNLFLLAIKQIGLEIEMSRHEKKKSSCKSTLHFGVLVGAVPKAILDVMNVPNLTRENVASHLQKYRIFLRKVADKGFLEGLSNRDLRSRFAFGLSASLVRDFQARTSKLRVPVQQYMKRITHQTGYKGIANAVKPYHVSSTNYVAGSPLGRCHQFSHPRNQYGNSLNQARVGVESSFGSNDWVNNIQQNLLGSYGNQPYYAINSYNNNAGVVFPSDGIMAHGWMSSANGLRGGVKYDDHQLMSPNYDSLVHYHQKYTYDQRNWNMGSWHDSCNNLSLTSSSTYNPNKNIQLNGGSQMIGNGMKRGFNSIVGIMDSTANNNFGLINATTQNTNRNVAPLGQGNFGFAQRGFTSTSASSNGEDRSSELPAALITNNGSRAENISGNLQLPQQVHESVAENDNATPISELNICHLEEDGLSDLFMILDEMNLLNESNSSASSDKNVNPTEATINLSNEFPTSSDKNSNKMEGDDGFVDLEDLDKFMMDNVSSASNSVTDQVWDIEVIKALFDEETN
ncbi:unnamed protein product [Sphenostylis stenocarpa]|uniref:Response regulatory domain-containing protein n=1 Tax=Sphenostylis stenocarpa TaxID=92480 RepID=A0AA86VH29_9FABA|nr:unnamed protein product [Sphenostylis stenocarpa]